MKYVGILLLPILFILLASCEEDPMPPREYYNINRIYSINLDGSNRKLIAVGSDFSLLSNNKIIYINEHRLYLSNENGSDKMIISPFNFEVYDYQLYMNHTKIVFIKYSYPNNSLYTMNLDGSEFAELNLPNNVNFNSGIRFSPDGSKIAFSNNTGLYIMNSDGSDQRQIKDTTNGSYCYYYEFTPDENRMIYIHNIQSGIALDLRLYDIKSTSDTSLFYNDSGNEIIAYRISQWNTLLFSNGAGINLEDLNNYTHIFLSRGGDPYFSNDSTKITFMNYDFNAIYIMDLTQHSTKLININLPKNYISHPILALDGEHVFFQADTSWSVLVKTNSNIVY